MKKRFLSMLIATVICVSMVGCGKLSGNSPENKNQTNQTESKKDDFYSSVNEEWLMDTKIPDGERYVGTLQILGKNASDRLIGIVEDYSKKKDFKENSNEKKLVDLYNTFLDYSNRDKAGMKPVEPYLNKIKNISSREQYNNVAIELMKNSYDSIFSYKVEADSKDSSTNILRLEPVTLGMKNKSNYIEQDENTKMIQEGYKKYLKKIFILKGDSESTAKEKANSVFEYEKMIASSMLSTEEKRNSEKLYNVYTIEQIDKLFPTIHMKKALTSLGLEKANKIVVSEPEYFKKMDSILKKSELVTLKSYLEAIVLMENAKLLTTDFEKAQFEFSKVTFGVNQMKPEKERAYEFVNKNFSQILGKIYAEKYFSNDAKKDVESIVKDIIKAYRKRINNLDWMSNATKEKAMKKLDTMNIKIGYPEEWMDYSSLDIKTYENGGSLVENVLNIKNFERKEQLKKLNKPVNKKDWVMVPQQANAYYEESTNEIEFPAAILQAPVYSYEATKAQNLGGIGTVIGHEISHAFDDQGSKFDENGNMINWWTDEDFAKYTERTKKLEEQYSKLEVLPNVFVNGKLTLGENIADLAGVSVALDVLKTTENPNYDEFFNTYAILWRCKMPDKSVRMQVKMDTHPPYKFRVNEVLKNIDEFYKTYNINEKDKMYVEPEKRIKIW